MRASDYALAAQGIANQAQASGEYQRQRELTDKKAEEDAMKEANANQAQVESAQSDPNRAIPPPAAPAAAPPPPTGIIGTVENAAGNLAHHVSSFFDMLTGHGKKADKQAPQGVPGQNSSPAPSSPDANASAAGTPPASGASSPAAATTAAGASSPQVDAAKATAIASDPAGAGKAAAVAADQTPHSMTHADWHAMDVARDNAVHAALMAGKDPVEVRKAMETMRTSFVQSGMLKYASAANTALMQGDQKGLEQAMKNMNYFLPNGQDLETHIENGVLKYIDPFDPTTKDGKPNYVPVTLQHIQLLAQNLTDPMKVQDTINTAITNKAKVAHEQAQDITARLEAEAKIREANTKAILAPAQIRLFGAHANYYDNWAQAQRDKAAAVASAKYKVPPAVAQKAADDGGKAAQNILLGQEETVPLQIKDPKTGQMIDNPSLVGGKSAHNNEVLPWWGKGADGKRLGPSDAAGSVAMSSSIAAANVIAQANGVPAMSAQEAATIGGKIYHLSHINMTQHTGPDGKSKVNDFKVSPDGQIGSLWQPSADGKSGTWRSFRMNPDVGQAFLSGADQSALTPEAPGEGEEDSSGTMATNNPADNAAAIPPAQ